MPTTNRNRDTSRVNLPGGFLVCVLSVLLSGGSASGQDESIDATEHTCVELRRLVDEASALKISYPRNQNYASNPNITLVFRPQHSTCPLQGTERLGSWPVEAADERCVLYTCQPIGGHGRSR